jgi:hypothetical protein
MRAARGVTAAGLAVVLGMGMLAACRTGEPTTDEGATTATEEPAATPTPTASEPEPEETAEPEPTAEAAVNGPNSITAPLAGDVVAGPTVTVSGEGTAFEATLLYRVTRAGTDEVVTEGYTMAGANGEVGPYSIDLTLDPGDYVVQVWEPDMGEGDAGGGQRNLVEVSFTVS